MEVGFVAGSLSHSPLMVSVRAGTLPLKAFIMSYVCFVLLNRLIQPAVPGYLRV